jgi:uncharacterized protein (DUF1684 family)
VSRTHRRPPGLDNGAMEAQTETAGELLDLLDWKRRVFALYADVRRAPDPSEGWHRWRSARDELFGSHPQTPLPVAERAGFAGLDYFEYDPGFRVTAAVVPVPPAVTAIGSSGDEPITFRRFAQARFAVDGDEHALELFWLEGYGGGLFLPFRDATGGSETYGGGRYLLDTVKGADLGMTGGRLLLDFNFAYNPSCCYDPGWICPLSPPANRLPIAVWAGERHSSSAH